MAISSDSGQAGESEAAERDDLLAALLEISPIATLIVKRDLGSIVHRNRRFTEAFGYTPEQVWDVESWWQRAYPDPEYRAKIRARWDAAIASRGDSATIAPVEAEVTCADGRVRQVEVYLGLVGANGIVLFVDVSDRKLAERELLDARGFLQAVVDQLPSMVFVKDETGRPLFANHALAENYGTTVEQFLAQGVEQICRAEEQGRKYAGDDLHVIRTGQKLVLEERSKAPNGQERWFHIVKVPLTRPDGSVHCLGIVTDVTEVRRAEERRVALESQVQQAQKLESLGLLAGGIAHDFNNLLTAMLGQVVLAQEELPPDSPTQVALKEIEAAAVRAAELTRQMLAYSGRGQVVAELVRLDQLVHEMGHLLRTAVSKKASFRLELEPALLYGEPAQIRQVVMNLVVNASESLGERPGVVTLKTFSRNLSGEALRVPLLQHDLTEGEYGYIMVTDSGSGMDAETERRMFEPFFTTKFAGRGLGLPAVLGIVRSHRGGLAVSSEPGVGTSITAYFPSSARSEEPVERASPRVEPSASTVLVIDDEAPIRFLAKRTLERAGFRVILAEDGPKGLEAYQHEPHAIDAIVLDLTMPIMDGWEVLAELERMNARVPVLLSSGYGGQAPADKSYENLRGFMAKPFRPEVLVERVRKMSERGPR